MSIKQISDQSIKSKPFEKIYMTIKYVSLSSYIRKFLSKKIKQVQVSYYYFTGYNVITRWYVKVEKVSEQKFKSHELGNIEKL